MPLGAEKLPKADWEGREYTWKGGGAGERSPDEGTEHTTPRRPWSSAATPWDCHFSGATTWPWVLRVLGAEPIGFQATISLAQPPPRSQDGQAVEAGTVWVPSWPCYPLCWAILGTDS